jgi:methyltransferase-like protein/SAM-dependent methyltransferase
MTEQHKTSYDEVPYGDNVFTHTHPDCIAAVSSLFGFAPPIENCRVLELGCGTGANLIPMAMGLPDGRFLGIDLSARQIERGQQMQAALGVHNLELHTRSILDLDAGIGTFDYIICHGVYSWVPPEVQDRILDICGKHLTPHGVAYVSYNTYPGWHIRGMVREMMGYHVRRFTEPTERVRQARAMLRFIIEAVGAPDTVWGKLLQSEADLLADASDTYIYHEHLEDYNQPIYFYQFMERAEAKGLRYLAEARPVPLMNKISPQAAETLREVSEDVIQAEQYLDYVRNRTFRRTLLCRRELRHNGTPTAATLEALHLTGLVQPTADGKGPPPPDTGVFSSSEGVRISTSDPRLKTALRILARAWPMSVPFGELYTAVQDQLQGHAGSPQELANELFQCYMGDLVELRARPSRFTTSVAQRPTASRLARLQAESGNRVTNLRHRMVELDGLAQMILTLLDGQRDRGAVLDALTTAAIDGGMEISHQGAVVNDPNAIRQGLDMSLNSAIERLARSAILMV